MFPFLDVVMMICSSMQHKSTHSCQVIPALIVLLSKEIKVVLSLRYVDSTCGPLLRDRQVVYGVV